MSSSRKRPTARKRGRPLGYSDSELKLYDELCAYFDVAVLPIRIKLHDIAEAVGMESDGFRRRYVDSGLVGMVQQAGYILTSQILPVLAKEMAFVPTVNLNSLETGIGSY